ncbi:MAG: GLPGLI family protein [Paramuribaculum sp.]|nr:GLPGLI family protein [Paramuribaculum sp.]
MKKILSLILVGITAVCTTAQTSEIEVSYTAYMPNMRDGSAGPSNQYILLANESQSKFYSPRTEYIDSLNSTPDGRAKYQEMARNAYFSGNMDNMPSKDGTYYIVKSLDEDKHIYYDNAGLDKYFYEEPVPRWEWEIGDSVKEILGYECFKATTDFHGRHWTVWFTPEIPIMNGPWKFDRLLGLILEAESEGGEYRFVATGIQQTRKPITPVYLADSYERTNRIDYLKAKRAFLDNPMGQINAQLGGNITVVKADGNTADDAPLFVPSSVVDLIETDYHK